MLMATQVQDFVNRFLPAYDLYLPQLYEAGPPHLTAVATAVQTELSDEVQISAETSAVNCIDTSNRGDNSRPDVEDACPIVLKVSIVKTLPLPRVNCRVLILWYFHNILLQNRSLWIHAGIQSAITAFRTLIGVAVYCNILSRMKNKYFVTH
jgi:hypothetical protein